MTSYGLKDFITIVTGAGCNWGKCGFCNSGAENYSLRSLDEVIGEFRCIAELSDSEIMLSSDSMSVAEIGRLSLRLCDAGNKRRYNLMMRADRGVDTFFSDHLRESPGAQMFLWVERYSMIQD